MKYLAPLFLITSFIVCHPQLDQHRFDIIDNLNDSVAHLTKGKNFLYYTKGHHGHIWSVVIPENDYYIISSGNTRNNDFRIDTISLDIQVLRWGLDTMSLYSNKMGQGENLTYSPFYERLVLFSSQNKIIFDCSNSDIYRGPDSAAINKSLNELKYLMYWIALPVDIQKKLPSPAFKH